MAEHSSPYQLWVQAGGDSEEYHRLMVEHGHLVPRPACTCRPPRTAGTGGNDPAHWPGCPRFNDNDRRLPCGWLPGEAADG
jgi:hypothetical protein